jgi:hypothetical protein
MADEHDVLEALWKLGNTPDEVVVSLKKKRVRGKRGCPEGCPLTNYIRKLFKQDLEVTGTAVHVSDDSWDEVAVLPRAFQLFVRLFDEGHYPELEEKP